MWITKYWKQLYHNFDENYDLISGYLGISVYLLNRLPRTSAKNGLRMILEHLASSGINSGDGIYWLTPREHIPQQQLQKAPEGYINLGIAHGMAGILGLLCRLGKFSNYSIAELARKAIRWLQRQEQDAIAQSRFPNWITQQKETQKSRIAWCYGDLGVGYVIHKSAQLLNEPLWAKDAIRIVDATLTRSTDEFEDRYLCHGAAGAAHLYMRLFQATNLKRYEYRAYDCFTKALEPSRSRQGLPLGERNEFLEGDIGVALALMAMRSTTPRIWEDLMLI